MENNRTWIIVAVVIGVLFLLCTCCTVSAGLLLVLNNQNPSKPQPTPTEENVELPLTPAPSPPPKALETLDAIQETVVPQADIHDLGIRLLGIDPNTPRVASTENPDYPLGTVRRFHASNVDTEEQFEVDAELRYKTPHLYMWVEKGISVNEEALREAADLFEEHTYPTNRNFFGSEWTPGVDGDPHLSVLHATNLGATVAGYFSSPDEYVQEVRSDSNEMEMFYINLDNITIGSDFYNGVLAHEFQHMIHWYNDRNEETWLNEGCSELAMALNDRAYKPGYYEVGGSDISYAYAPDTQLTTWPEGTAGDASANYGAAYLFMEYFLERYGETATQALVAHDTNGMESIDATLASLGKSENHKALLAEWIVANLLDDPSLADGRYGYRRIDPYTPYVDIAYGRQDYPVAHSSAVHQYGVDYVEIEAQTPLSFTFSGTSTVKLMNTDAYSGQYLWWSNRSDESDSMLTRRVDLSAAEQAELSFKAWYHIEEDWDYAYLLVGTTESGVLPEDLHSTEIRWTILNDARLDCTTTDPNGNNYGCGLTGQSGGWQTLHADLTDFVGQEIALRFEYITDAAVNQPGLALDDIVLTVDGENVFQDDAEEPDPAWSAEGFVRHANVLAQEWIVQLVVYEHGGPVVTPLLQPAEGLTHGSWVLPLGDNADQAVIAISALAPVTTENAPYTFSLTPATTP
ncbi:MAG: hypothetical protein ACP5HM_07110 [Anaerolineae bacterium]